MNYRQRAPVTSQNAMHVKQAQACRAVGSTHTHWPGSANDIASEASNLNYALRMKYLLDGI